MLTRLECKVQEGIYLPEEIYILNTLWYINREPRRSAPESLALGNCHDSGELSGVCLELA